MPRLERELKEHFQAAFSGEKEVFATVLLALLIKAYGVEVLNWDGITIQLQVKDDAGIDIPRKVYDKVQGLITALTTDAVYKEVPVFDEIISALAGRGLGVDQDVPSVDDVAWTVAEMGINDPDPITRDPKSPWSRNIGKYVRVVLDDEGMNIAPKILEFAPNKTTEKEGMDDPQYYAGAWGSQQERADEIDAWVERQTVVLVQQLMNIGLNMTEAK